MPTVSASRSSIAARGWPGSTRGSGSASTEPLRADLEAARKAPGALEPKAESALVLALAAKLEGFLARLFGIEAEAEALSARHTALAPVYRCKRLFVQRRAARAVKPAEAAALDGAAVEAALGAHLPAPVEEEAFAAAVMGWLADEAASGEALAAAARYAAWALHHPEGRARHGKGVLFRQPGRIDPMRLIDTGRRMENGADAHELPEARLRRREGFALTDPGMDLKAALDQAHYCIFCHKQGKDSCARGLRDRRSGAFARTVFGVELAGCPLEEKISEMQLLKAEGWALGALATVCIDNPLCAATGHRICNDCMKSCIYQRQDPGRYSAGRDARAEGRARPALGLRDLQPADALEPAEFRPPAAAAGQRPAGAGGGPRPGRLQPRPPSDE